MLATLRILAAVLAALLFVALASADDAAMARARARAALALAQAQAEAQTAPVPAPIPVPPPVPVPEPPTPKPPNVHADSPPAKSLLLNWNGTDPPGYHRHRCSDPSCGAVWTHMENSFGRAADHSCPKCGRLQWQTYRGQSPPDFVPLTYPLIVQQGAALAPETLCPPGRP